MGAPFRVEVEGVKELSRALKRVDSEAPKGLRLAFNSAADLVVTDTRAVMPRRKGRAVSSVKSKSTRTEARVSIGGNRAPYVPWLDYGGEGRRKGRPPARKFIPTGRYLYPSLRKNQTRIVTQLQTSLDDVIKSAGLDA